MRLQVGPQLATQAFVVAQLDEDNATVHLAVEEAFPLLIDLVIVRQRCYDRDEQHPSELSLKAPAISLPSRCTNSRIERIHP